MRLGDHAHLDLDRESRTGVPEVVLADAKADEDLGPIVEAFVRERGRVIVSRLDPHRVHLFDMIPCEKRYDARARILVASQEPGQSPRTGGRVLVLAAGTADVAVAEEARLVADELGCDTKGIYDVGVAGIHRLFQELDHAQWADVVIVTAGREGALAPVVAGLVDRPVIGLPVSVGYGHGGRGEAALLTMLQSCSPLTTVNIDGGTVAGACAAQIANRVARARRQSPGESTPRETEVPIRGARRE